MEDALGRHRIFINAGMGIRFIQTEGEEYFNEQRADAAEQVRTNTRRG